MDDFFERHEDKRSLYEAFLAVAERFGPVTVNVSKTRIAFQHRVRFAGVAGIRRDGLLCSFWLKRRIDGPRFTRVEHLPPNDYIYQFKIRDAQDIDAEVAEWIEEASRVGRQAIAG